MRKIMDVRDRLNKMRLDVNALYLCGEGLRQTADIEDGDAIARIAIRLQKKIDRMQADLQLIDQANHEKAKKQSAA